METVRNVTERVNEAVMGKPEPVSAEGAPAMVCIKVFMPHPGRELSLEDTLHEHYNNLKEAGLVSPRDCAARPTPNQSMTFVLFPFAVLLPQRDRRHVVATDNQAGTVRPALPGRPDDRDL